MGGGEGENRERLHSGVRMRGDAACVGEEGYLHASIDYHPHLPPAINQDWVYRGWGGGDVTVV